MKNNSWINASSSNRIKKTQNQRADILSYNDQDAQQYDIQLQTHNNGLEVINDPNKPQYPAINSNAIIQSQVIQESYCNPLNQGGVAIAGTKLSTRGNSGGSGNHRENALKKKQIGSNLGHFNEQQQDTQLHSGSTQITNQKIGSATVKQNTGSGIQPSHHKANSMQISSKYKASQLLQHQSNAQSLINQNIPQTLGNQSSSNMSGYPNRPNKAVIQINQKNPAQIYFNQKGATVKSNLKSRKNPKQSEVRSDYLNDNKHLQTDQHNLKRLNDDSIRNNSEGTAVVTAHSQNLSTNYGQNTMPKKQQKVILQNAAEQHIQAPFGNQHKNSHILMNNQHVKMKSGGNKLSAQSNLINTSPTQEDNKTSGAKEIAPVTQGQHKKANSLMNQKMMQLLLNKDQGGYTVSDTQGPYLVGQTTIGGKIIQQQNLNSQETQMMSGNFQLGQQIGSTIDGNRQGQTYHVKSKSLMQNNDFISVSADNTNINQTTVGQNRPVPLTASKQSKKAANLMGGQVQNDQQYVLTSGQINANSQLSKVRKNTLADGQIIQVGMMNSANIADPNFVNNHMVQGIGPNTIKNKVISSSFDKTANQGQIAQSSLKSHNLGIKQQSFHYPNKTKNNIKVAGQPSSMQQSIVVTSSTSNLHQVQNTGTGNLHEPKLRAVVNSLANALNIAPQGPQTHNQIRSDTQNFNIQSNNNPVSKNKVVISSINHIYPNQGPKQYPQRTQSKKASNVKSMSNNNQVSSQGATKGLLKYQKQPNQTQDQSVFAGNRSQQQGISVPGGTVKKNQFTTIANSNYKNLVNDSGQVNPNNKANEEVAANPNIGNSQITIDLEVFNSSQNKTTEQKYEELKLKYDDLLNKHFALAAQKTEDLRDPKKSVVQGGHHYGRIVQPVSTGIVQNLNRQINDEDQGVQRQNKRGINKFPGQAHTTQQTLEPPQIIMNEIQNQGAIPNQYRRSGVGSKGSRGSKGSTRHMRLSQNQDSQQYNDEINNNMVQIINEANGAAEAELNMIIGGSVSALSGGVTNGKINTMVNSNQQSQNHTPRGIEQSMMYMGSINESVGGFNGGYVNSINPNSTKNDRVMSQENSQNVSSSNFTAQSDQLQNNNVYHLNLRGNNDLQNSHGQTTGKNSNGSTIVSRTEGVGPIIARQNQHFSDDVARQKGQSKQTNIGRQQQYGAGQAKTIINKNHKRSVSDGGIFNNMGLKAKAMEVIGGLKDFTGAMGPAYMHNQQQIPTKDKSIQNSQKSFEMKINEIRSANGLPTHNQGAQIKMNANHQVPQNTRYLEHNMMILEEGDDEREDKTITHNTIISQQSYNEENIHTEMAQEHSVEFNLNPHNSNLLIQGKNQMNHRQNANSSDLSNDRGIAQMNHPGAAYFDGPQLKPGKKDQVQRMVKPSDGNFAMIIEEDQSDIQRPKKNKTKSMMMGTNKATLDSEVDTEVNQNIQMVERNRLAKKYKQMRKTGEHGQTHTGQILRHGNQKEESLIEMTSHSGMFIQEGVSELGNTNTHNALRKKSIVKHRRVKSGASDQIANKNLIGENIASTTNQSKVILFKDENQAKRSVKQDKNNFPDSKKRSMKKIPVENTSGTGAQNKYMLIYEDPQKIATEQLQSNKQNPFIGYDIQPGQILQAQEGDTSIDLLQDENDGTFEPFGDKNNNKKVINVSFNDFNQSISNEYEDRDLEASKEYNENAEDIDGNYSQGRVSYQDSRNSITSPEGNFNKEGENLKVGQNPQGFNGILGQNQTSNKNLNTFLEALQKIKPQNPVNSAGSGTKKKNSVSVINSQVNQKQTGKMNVHHQKMKSEMPKSQKNAQQIQLHSQNPKVISMSGNAGNQLRLEKYQKMMQKVKQNDKQMQSKNQLQGVQVSVNQNHNRIKSTNIDASNGGVSAYQIDGTQAPTRAKARREGNYSVDARGSVAFNNGINQKESLKANQPFEGMPEVSEGFPIGSGQSSGKNLKITFVGDQALLNKQKFGPNIMSSQIASDVTSNAPEPRFQFHQVKKGHGETNLNSNSVSNTGGQPSPIISKRMSKKINNNGDDSLSPTGYVGQRTRQIQQNNYTDDTDQGYPDSQQLELAHRAADESRKTNNRAQVSNQVFSVETIETHPVSAPGLENPNHGRISPLLENGKPKQKAQPSQGMWKKKQTKKVANSDNDPNNFFAGQEYANEGQFISGFGPASQNIQPLQDQQNGNGLSEVEQSNLIQNLNKFERNRYAEEGDEDAEQLIHIINRPVPSFTSKKGMATSPQSSFLSPNAPQVSERQERLVTEESNCNGGSLTPRSKNIRKLIKLIKLGFRQSPAIPPDTTIDFYRIGKILGKGAFGKVNLAVHKLSQCLCAVKSINKQFFSDDSQTKKVMQEVVMLKKTRHQNIVRLYEYFETEKHILFVIELCAGGDLLNYVRRRRRLKEDVAKCLFKQIIQSLAYCHSKSILHRDIKLDNILLDANGQVKICDFGVGKIVKKGEKMTEQCGTPAYIAPEILRDKGYFGFKVDIWSAGVVLYAMLYGTVPFKANNMTELQKIIMKAKYCLKEDISLEARDLLKGLLEKEPAKRLSISQILGHIWLKDAVDASDMELFTEQERQYIKTEYSYGKSSRYGRNNDMSGTVSHGLPDPLGMSSVPGLLPQIPDGNLSELDKDMFTEHALDSTQNSILKNCETKSVILAPFNSTKSNLPEIVEGEEQPIMELSDSIKELIEPSRIIKFGPRVRDIDKQYEINNNADLDNGVYHKFDEDEEENNESTNQEEENSDEKNENASDIEKPFDEADYDPEEREILQQLKKQGQKKKEQSATGKKKKQSELQRLEDMIHDQEEKEKQTTREDNLVDHDEIQGNQVTQNSNQQHFNQLQNTENSLLSISQGPSPARGHNNDKIMNIVEGNGAVGQALNTEESYISSMGQYKDQRLSLLYQSQVQNEILNIDENIINNVVEFEYPRPYLEKCLSQNELNYATTSYWLLYFTKRVQDIGEKWQRDRQEKDEKEQIIQSEGLKLQISYSNGQDVNDDNVKEI